MDDCCQWCFKSLIHLFIVALVVSFAYVIWVIEAPVTDDIGLSSTKDYKVDMLDFYISHHPAFYGLSRLGHSAGLVEKDKLAHGLLDLIREAGDTAPDVFVHPLYV